MTTTPLTTIESILGRFNEAGRAALLEAIDENPDGCISLAHRVAGRTGVTNPPGLYLRCLAEGDHRNQPTRTPSGPRHYPGSPPRPPLTPEQLEHNRVMAPLLRRIVSTRGANQALRRAMEQNPGTPLLELMQSVVDECDQPTPTLEPAP